MNNRILSGAYPKYLNEPGFYKNKEFVFIDISGFTPMCDKFIRESSYGAEKIGELVNTVFNPIIDHVYEMGGDVISFAGDAILVALKQNTVEKVSVFSKKLIKGQKEFPGLDITIESMGKDIYPHFINSRSAGAFCFYPSEYKDERLQKDQFPDVIYKIKQKKFSGELRAVPLFFIHIPGKYTFSDIKPVLEHLLKGLKKHSVYLNKIEFMDKGWMILLTAGSPLYSAEAPVKMYDLINKLSKKARSLRIPLQSGGTLQRGYCGIIGNGKRWEFSFLGSNVNLAARISVASEPYGITVDRSFAEAVKTSLKTVSTGCRSYKGIGEREIFKVTGKHKVKKDIFVGRETEIEKILKFLSASNGTLVVINGPSGIGKTVLVEKVIKDAGFKNIIKLKGTHGEDEPLGIFRNFGEFDKASSAQYFSEFKAINKPTLIYIDDLHFGDEKSFFLFHRMINDGNPFVSFICTTIGTEKINITPLCSYSNEIITLKPFDAGDIRKLTQKYAGIKISLKVSNELRKSTKGHPLFINGILPYISKDLESSGKVPYTLQEVILLKLSAVPGKGPEFIDGGSVYGDIFDQNILREVVAVRERMLKNILNSAENEGIVRKTFTGDNLEFSNTIIRETIYERLLKKKIDFFRVKIAESILDSQTEDVKKLYKAIDLLFDAEDKRAPGLSLDYTKKFSRKLDRTLVRDLIVRSLQFIQETGETEYSYKFIELFIQEKDSINVTGSMIDIIEQTAIELHDWKGNHRFILSIARTYYEVKHLTPVKLLNKYLEMSGKDKYYEWTKIKTTVERPYRKKAVNVLNSLINKFSGEEKGWFLIDYVWYSFFILGNVDMEKKGLKKLSEIKRMKNDLMKEYLLLRNTIAMHRDDMETAKKCLDAVNRLVKDPVKRFGLYNDYAIIFSNSAFENEDPGLTKKALKYSEKAHKVLVDHELASELPLVTTNLASFYLSAGKMRKAEKAFMEGLYYGLAIDHPVEVPYTKSRMIFMMLASGSYKLALSTAEEVIRQKKVTDLLPSGYITRYLYGRMNLYDLKNAMKYAEEMVGFGTSKCLWEISSITSGKAVVENDTAAMKKCRNNLIEWGKYPQRQGNRFGNDTSRAVLGTLSGVIDDVKELEKNLQKLEKMQTKFSLIASGYYALGKFRQDEQILKKAKRTALKMKMYPLVKRIEEELYSVTGKSYWKRCVSISKKKLKKMNSIETIEEFFGYGDK